MQYFTQSAIVGVFICARKDLHQNVVHNLLFRYLSMLTKMHVSKPFICARRKANFYATLNLILNEEDLYLHNTSRMLEFRILEIFPSFIWQNIGLQYNHRYLKYSTSEVKKDKH